MDQENRITEYPAPTEETYQTGRTQPPKSHGGLIAMLLGLVILLCGVTSALSLMNIRMFWELKFPEQKAGEISLSFTRESEPVVSMKEPEGNTPAATAPSLQLELETVPPETLPPPAEEVRDAEEEPVPTEPIPTQPAEFPLEQVAEKAMGAMAQVSCGTAEGSTAASGIVIAPNGYVLVESDAVNNAKTIQVQLKGREVLEAVLIGKDDKLGLAVLHVPATDLPALSFCDAEGLCEGEQLAAIPSGRLAQLMHRLPGLLQTDLSVSAGEPLLNRHGQVVGISVGNMGMPQQITDAIGFAVPSSALKESVERIIREYKPEEDPSLGVIAEAIPLFYQLYYELPDGFYITAVDDASDAFLKGITIGDILVSINGQSLDEITDLTQLLETYKPGDTVSLVVYRSGKNYELNIILGEE